MNPVAVLDAFLRARQLDTPHITGLVVALSAGPDSYALLCAATQAAHRHGFALRALHVHHGLHPDADNWAQQATQQASIWHIPLQILRIAVPSQASLERAARQARYDALAAALSVNEALLIAHHQDDQAETLLLRLMRGAGVQGLAAMRAQSLWRSKDTKLPAMQRWRPWLGLSREVIADWLSRVSQIATVNDPANVDVRFDRSVVRHQVLPILQQRWPQASELLARSSQQLAQQADALNALCDELLQRLCSDRNTLDIKALQALTDAARHALIARWLSRSGAPALPYRYWPRVAHELLSARVDAQPQLAWAGWSLRRYREQLYIYHDAATLELPPAASWPDPRQAMEWAGHTWSLDELCPTLDESSDLLRLPWRLAARVGGERLRLVQLDGMIHRTAQGQTSHRVSLKHWCQAQAIPPWLRQRLVCVWAGDTVVAIRLMD